MTARHDASSVTLRDEVPASSAPDDAVLARMELASPGDTIVRAEGDRVVVTRHVFASDPSSAHEARAAFAKTVGLVRGLVAGIDAVAAATQRAAVPEPVFPPPIDLGPLVERYRTVEVAQPAWSQPDGTLSPVGQLVPGTSYELVDRRGDWALIDGPGLELCWTDARSLIEVLEGGAEP